jgi:hypothetical protein
MLQKFQLLHVASFVYNEQFSQLWQHPFSNRNRAKILSPVQHLNL